MKKWRRDRLTGTEDSLRFDKGKLAVVLNPRIAITMIVIHFIRIESVQQTLKVIETMTVMAADR